MNGRDNEIERKAEAPEAPEGPVEGPVEGSAEGSAGASTVPVEATGIIRAKKVKQLPSGEIVEVEDLGVISRTEMEASRARALLGYFKRRVSGE